jgi:hypothetical protein
LGSKATVEGKFLVSFRVSQPAFTFPVVNYNRGGKLMNSIIYIVGLVVVIGAVLAFLGLR